MLDSKHELDWSGFQVTDNLQDAFRSSHTIYRPPRTQVAAYVDALCERIYTEGAWTLYTDEIYAIGRGHSQSYPQSFINLLTRGRSRHISVFSGTQRPAFMPRFCFTEARHIFLFELGDEDDSKHVAKMAGVKALGQQQLSGHQFVYYNRERKKMIRTELGRNQI